MPLGRRRNRIDRSLRERGVPPEPQVRERERATTTGPWDDDDAPDDGLPRVDVGALRVPAPPGMELRLELDAQQRVVGVTLLEGESALQIAAFAAPRNNGIWADVRREILTTASGQGASLKEVRGPFGPELSGTVVTTPPPQQGRPAPTKPVRRAARFFGVDGPRWFLRGLLSGPAAGDPAAGAAFEEAYRGVIVVRGSDPMPVRDPLPMRLPAQAAEQLAQQQAAEQNGNAGGAGSG